MLPFDALKLDASFVRTTTSHRESRKIVAAVMGLCQNLGLTSVAEGIESQSQWEMLRSLGYHTGQGWLFGRPAPAAQASAMLDDAQQKSQTESVARIAEQVALRLEAMPIQCLWQLRALYEGAPVGLAFVDPELRGTHRLGVVLSPAGAPYGSISTRSTDRMEQGQRGGAEVCLPIRSGGTMDWRS